MKKKIIFFAFLLIFAGFLSAQTSTTTVFEGTWYGNDDGAVTHFIFINNNMIMIHSGTGEIIMGTFTHNNSIIAFNIKRYFSDSIWQEASGGSMLTNLEYVFSGNSLIIVFNGGPISLKKAN